MGLIDFILNLAGLLLWLNWRAARFNPLNRRTPATLMGTLRPAVSASYSRWPLLAFITALLLLRGVFYRLVSSISSTWTGHVDLQVIVLSFRSDSFLRMLEFSFFSFGVTLGIFYSWLFLLSALAGPEPLHRLIKVQIGRVDAWPAWVKLLAPIAAAAILWLPAGWLLAEIRVVPHAVSVADKLEKSLVIGIGQCLTWKYPLGAILILHLLNTYIYFGKHPFWNYVGAVAEKLLRPLRGMWASTSAHAYSPAVKAATKGLLTFIAIVLTFLLAELAARGLIRLYTRLPI
jgi:hypothetical protein